jgi:hypothetical protein
VVRNAIRKGWSLRRSRRGHAWGMLLCPRGARGGCMVFVPSTPRSPKANADRIKREVDKCQHG